MLHINKRLATGQGLAPALLRRAPSVTLDWDLRQKSRFEATDSQGRQLGVFLPRGTQVRGGDVLVAEDGSLIRVEAAPQPVMVVTTCPAHGSPFDLLRAAYHLGNRHVALALQPDRLLLEPDPVLADMLRRMHLIVVEANEAFEPEGGAYAAEAAHGHVHAHAEPHTHEAGPAHEHEHEHEHGHGQGAAHVHSTACRHEQAHGHADGPARVAPVVMPVVPVATGEHPHSDACRHGPGHGHGH